LIGKSSCTVVSKSPSSMANPPSPARQITCRPGWHLCSPSAVFFYGPSELAQKAPHEGQRLRIGGLVKQGSLVHEGKNTVRFAVTDTKQEVAVTYTGVLPDLFHEGQGVVRSGLDLRPPLALANFIRKRYLSLIIN
jgi:hypothetical protein